jgi:hypothetical protein
VFAPSLSAAGGKIADSQRASSLVMTSITSAVNCCFNLRQEVGSAV